MKYLNNEQTAALLRELAIEIEDGKCAHQYFTCFSHSEGWTIGANTDLGEAYINKESSKETT